jgi:quercetin dioxygenase-like cupin family protein
MRELVNKALKGVDGQFASMYANSGRDSVAPEKLMRALLLQVLYSLRSERQIVEQLRYNLLYRWFVVGVFFFFMLLHQTDKLMIGSLQVQISDDFQLNNTQWGTINSLALFVATILYPIWGYLFDRYARTKLIAFASFVWGATTWLNAVVRTYGGFLVTRASTGIDDSSYPGIFTLIADYFGPGLRGKVYGILQLAQPLGFLVGLILGQVVAPMIGGWRSVFYITGALGLVVAALAGLRVEQRTETVGGHRVVYDVANDIASYGAARVEGQALVWQLDDTAEEAEGARVSRRIQLDPFAEWVMRCDRIDFPPGGVAHTHTHPGPGIRYLLQGELEIRTEGRSTFHGRGSAWFESGPEPVYAEASQHQETAFVRVLVLPAEWEGKRTIRYVDLADEDKPKLQRSTVFFDHPITLPR